MTFGEYLERALRKDGTALGDEDLLARARALKEGRLRKSEEGGESRHASRDDRRGGVVRGAH